MRTRDIRKGRHRLGSAGRVHCILIPVVAAYLRAHRRSWFTVFTVPPKHGVPAGRRRPYAARIPVRWVPATAG